MWVLLLFCLLGFVEIIFFIWGFFFVELGRRMLFVVFFLDLLILMNICLFNGLIVEIFSVIVVIILFLNIFCYC